MIDAITGLYYSAYELAFALLLTVAMVRIYQRAGLAPYWAVLGLIPTFGLLFVLIPLALKPWPTKRFDRNGPIMDPAGRAGR